MLQEYADTLINNGARGIPFPGQKKGKKIARNAVGVTGRKAGEGLPSLTVTSVAYQQTP